MSIKHTITASLIMLLTMALLQFVSYPRYVKTNKSLSTFPKQIGEWIGQEDHFDQKVIDKVGVDDYVLYNYHTSAGNQVQLYIGFYESQREGRLIHSPKNCMPGSGWTIIQTSLEDARAPSGNVKVIKLILQKGSEKLLMLYWFHSRGRIVASEYLEKMYLVIDSITRQRTDGSFVRLIAPVHDNDENRTITSLKDFVNQLIPILFEYLPS